MKAKVKDIECGTHIGSITFVPSMAKSIGKVLEFEKYNFGENYMGNSKENPWYKEIPKGFLYHKSWIEPLNPLLPSYLIREDSSGKLQFFNFCGQGDEEGIVLFFPRFRSTIAYVKIYGGEVHNPANEFTGVAFCHRNDKYYLTEGVKQACRKALQIGNFDEGISDSERTRRRNVYRSIREALNNQEEVS